MGEGSARSDLLDAPTQRSSTRENASAIGSHGELLAETFTFDTELLPLFATQKFKCIEGDAGWRLTGTGVYLRQGTAAVICYPDVASDKGYASGAIGDGNLVPKVARLCQFRACLQRSRHPSIANHNLGRLILKSRGFTYTAAISDASVSALFDGLLPGCLVCPSKGLPLKQCSCRRLSPRCLRHRKQHWMESCRRLRY